MVLAVVMAVVLELDTLFHFFLVALVAVEGVVVYMVQVAVEGILSRSVWAVHFQAGQIQIC